MKKNSLIALYALLSANCFAAEFPVVGVLEQLPVAPNDFEVVARPTYILTNTKISKPTVFTGLQGMASVLSPLCCFQVKNLTPLSLDKEAKKYAADPDFASHMQSIKGYAYIYAAEPTTDRSQWTPLMSTVMSIAGNLEDASPFSAPVVAGIFTQKNVPRTFMVGDARLTLSTRHDKKSDRLIYTFQQDSQKVEFSESMFAD